MESGLKERTIYNLFWKFMDQFFTQGVTTVVAIVLARLLMPSDYGVVSAALIVINICDSLASDGFASALIQKKDADEVDFSSIFYTALGTLTVLYFLLFFSAPYVSLYFKADYELLTPVLRVLCLKIPISAFSVIQQAYVSRNLMFKRLFWVSSVGTVASAFIGIGMALHGMGPWALVAQYLSNTVIDTVFFALIIRWRPMLCYSWARTKKMLSFSVNLLAASLLDTVCDDLRSIIIGHRYHLSALAFFDKGKRFPHIVVGSINNSLMAVLYPTMTKIQDDKSRLREVVRKAAKVSTYTLFPCLFGLAAVAEPFVSLTLTDKWLPCVPYVRIFCFFYAFYPIYTAGIQATKAMGKSGTYALTQASKKVVDIVCLVVSAPFGVYWIAIGALVSKFFVYIINGISVNIALGYSLRRQTLDILPNLLLSSVMYGFVMLFPVSSDHSIVILGVKCLAGCAVYILLSIATRNESFLFLWDMIKKRLGRVSRAIRKTSQSNQAMHHYSSCLERGSYRVDPTKTIIYREDFQAAAAQESALLYKAKERQSELGPIDRLIGGIYRGHVGKGTKKFSGQLLMSTSSEKEVKLFDYAERKIATAYQERREAETALKNRTYWASYFPVVPFEPELRGDMLVETMVEKQPYDSENALRVLFPDYVRYIAAQERCGGFTRCEYDAAQVTRFLDLLGRPQDYDALLRLLKLPACLTHGDLWTSNILYDGETFFHIDFEHMASRIFFFDVLMYIFSDCYLNQNRTLLNQYFEGEYDSQMGELFRAADCEYQSSERLLYLEGVIFLLFTERWDCGGSSKVMEDMRALVGQYSPGPEGQASEPPDTGRNQSVPPASCEKDRGCEKPLRNFSIAIVGVDGTGKSTLVKLLADYYGDQAHIQYMGYHPSSFTTLPLKLFSRLHKLRPLLMRFHLDTSLYMLLSWHEMKVRLRRALRHRDKLILFDRYCWEVNDNAESPFAFRLSDFLFHRHFPSPTGVIYLYCPTELSLRRKDDIPDKEAFVWMKEHTDRIYLSRPDTLVIDTSSHTPEQTKSLAVEYISSLFHDR